MSGNGAKAGVSPVLEERRPQSTFRVLADLVAEINQMDDLALTIERIASAARALGWHGARVALGSEGKPEREERAIPIGGGAEHLGTLFVLGPSSGGESEEAARVLAHCAAMAIRLSRLQAMLDARTNVDQITGLLNRKGFDSALRREVERVYRTANPLSAIVVDLDRFQRVGETYGQIAADAALQSVAEILRAGLRQADIAARVGSDLFRILLPGTASSGARDVAERLRCTIAAANFQGIGTVTATFGLAALPEHAANGAGLLHAAEAAMQTGKRRGRNVVSVALPLRG